MNESGVVYHYTDFNAFEGIFKEKSHGQFWLFDSREMNDETEMATFIDTIKKRVASQLNSTEKKILEEEFAKQSDHIPYIMSFSRSCDDAAQWERYADGAKGVCIGFDNLKMERFSHICNSFNIPTIWQPVYYTVPEHELVGELTKQIKGHSETMFETIDGAVASTYACAPAFKRQSFKSENEKRLVVSRPVDEENISFMKTPGLIKKYYKIDWMDLLNKNNEVPFTYNIEEPFTYNEFITDIIIGPQSRQSPEVLKEYLQYAGYPALMSKVKRSNCPIVI